MGNFAKKFNPLTPFKVTHNIGKNLLGGNLKGAFNASNPFYKAPGGNVPPPAMGAPSPMEGSPLMGGGIPGGATPGLLENAISSMGMQEGAGMPGAMPEMGAEDKQARRAAIAANRVKRVGLAPGAVGGGKIDPGMVTNKMNMF